MNTKRFDALVIGGGAAGMSCALVLGSAVQKPYAADKKIGIVMHQRASALDRALFNNVLGLSPGTTGQELLNGGKEQLGELYPHVDQIEGEKVLEIERTGSDFDVITNKDSYTADIVVIAVGPSNLFNIKGLESYVEPHPLLPPAKQRIQLRNTDHLVEKNLFVAGVLAGWRSQFAMAAGSGAHVATDILTLWNDGNTAMVHDSLPK